MSLIEKWFKITLLSWISLIAMTVMASAAEVKADETTCFQYKDPQTRQELETLQKCLRKREGADALIHRQRRIKLSYEGSQAFVEQFKARSSLQPTSQPQKTVSKPRK
ncbi:hypothetical protein WDW89_25410 [Deltaproteobacteria bacterium TL4]